MNRDLEAEVSSDEIKYVLSYFKKGKSRGLDGLSMELFGGLNDLIEHDLVQIVKESKTPRKVLWALNSTFIALIPKKKLMVPFNIIDLFLCEI